MECVRRLIAGMFLTTFILGGCAFPGDKQRVRLSDNWLTVPLAKSGSHTRGQQYSLHRLRNPDDYNPRKSSIDNLPKSSVALIPNSGFFDKSDHSVLVDELPVARGGEVDGTVTFELPPGPVSAMDCFMVVNTGHWATALSGAKSPDSKYLIGLAPFAARAELIAARENLRSAELDIAEARATLAASHAYVGGQCILREAQLPLQPHSANSRTPNEVAQLAENVAIGSLVKRVGCDATLLVLRYLRWFAPFKRFTRKFTCGLTDLSSLATTTGLANAAESLFPHCIHPVCLGLYARGLFSHFEDDVAQATKQLSQPYLQNEMKDIEVSRQVERNEYSRCSDMLGITKSADDTIATINKSIVAAEQNLELKAKRNPDGSYEFDADTLTCRRTLSSYYVRGNRKYID